MANTAHQSGAEAQIDAPAAGGDNNATLKLDIKEIMLPALNDASVQAFMMAVNDMKKGGCGCAIPSTDIYDVKDWTRRDIDSQFGLVRRNEGYSFERIRGADGNTYALDMDYSHGGPGRPTVFEKDIYGNKVEVTDPAVIKDITARGNYLAVIDAAQDRIAKLGWTDDQRQDAQHILDAVGDKNPEALQEAVMQYLTDGGDFQKLLVGLGSLAKVQVKDLDMNWGHGPDHDTMSIKFAGSDHSNFDFTWPPKA